MRSSQFLIICGPTATGKTNLGIRLAKQFNGEIISADSRQVYKGLDIGTGKDLPVNAKISLSGYYIINGIKLWGYDLVKPNQDFSLAHFIDFTIPLIKTLQQQKILPVIVGGTGLYLKALTQTLDTINIKVDKRLRQKLNSYSVSKLQQLLKKLKAQKFNSMNRSDQHNPRRLIRAIEVAKSSYQGPSLKVEPADTLWLGLKASLYVLDKRIASRVDQRLKLGAKQEVRRLINQGYSWDLPAMSAMGYKEFRPFFQDQASLTQVSNDWIKAEKKYLRRQLTWFKKVDSIHWFDITKKTYSYQVETKVKAWYTNIYADSPEN